MGAPITDIHVFNAFLALYVIVYQTAICLVSFWSLNYKYE